MLIGKTFKFEAAHHLPNHDGKCRRPHGHSYVVEVVLRGSVNQTPGDPKEGMVVDFSDLGAAFKQLVFDRVDHQDLNVVLADEVPVTTAENISRWVFRELERAKLPVYSVKVWETATSWAEVSVASPSDLL